MLLKHATQRAVLALCAMIGVAHAADPLPMQTQLAAAANAAVTSPIQPVTFTISPAEDLTVTLTDLQIPAALSSAGVVVTQAGVLVGSGLLSNAVATTSFSLPAASGVYSLSVFGAPNASYSVGSYSLCVAPTASPTSCITQSAAGSSADAAGIPSFAGLITAQNSMQNPTVSTFSTTLNVAASGSYTFNFSDLAFPTALSSAPNVALFQGSQAILPPGQTTPGIPAGTALTLSPGVYTLLSIAQADQSVQEGLYEISIAGPSGTTPLLSSAIPVGLLPAAAMFSNPAAQNVTLSVTDYGFPGALAGASALLTAGGTAVGSASASGGAQTFAAPSGTLALWTYGSMGGTAGTYSADVSAGTADLYTVAQGVGPSGTTYTYAYVLPPPTVDTTGLLTETGLTAGAYTATASDLQFPSQLGGLSFAVAQNGVLLQQSMVPATVNFTAAAGNAILLVSATAPTSTTSPNGLFDVNVQSTGTSAGLVFDQTQSVSATPTILKTQSLTIAENASYDVSLTDLKFPQAFDSLALVVTRGSDVLGKIFATNGTGTFSFTGTPGTYTLTFVGTPYIDSMNPANDQQFGFYADSVVFSPPTVTLTSSASTAASGSDITLTWNATNSSSCSGSGGSFTGSGTSGTASVKVSATATYTMTCTGEGGTGAQSVNVTVTAATAKTGGGGALDPLFLAILLGLSMVRLRAENLLIRR